MTSADPRAVPRLAYLQLALNIVLFGLSWPIVKIGLQAASPIWFAAARAMLSAATAFTLLACLGRLRWPARGDWAIMPASGTSA